MVAWLVAAVAGMYGLDKYKAAKLAADLADAQEKVSQAGGVDRQLAIGRLLEAAGPPPFDYDVIPPGCFVYDVSYGQRTPLLQAAEERGLPHADGLNMLLYAAERAFTLWTGLDAPFDVMRRAATTELEKRKL